MKLLIVYGTTEGQTRKIATFIADHARGNGHQVALFDSTDMPERIDIDGSDAIIAAGSVASGTPSDLALRVRA